jgi:molecular chaperone GrpE
VIASFLEILDDLDRALASSEASPTEGMRAGVEMVRDQFLAKLAAHGVTRLDTLGKTFDPATHEAVALVDVDDPAAVNTVVTVIRPAYCIDGELLRPAGVSVGR